MSETLQTTDVAAPDADLLSQTAIVVRAAGSALRERFGEVVRYETREELMRALAANDDTALAILRPGLTRLRPNMRLGGGRAGRRGAAARRVVGRGSGRRKRQPPARPSGVGGDRHPRA